MPFWLKYDSPFTELVSYTSLLLGGMSSNYKQVDLPACFIGRGQNVVGEKLYTALLANNPELSPICVDKPPGAGPRHTHLTTFWVHVQFAPGCKHKVIFGVTAHAKVHNFEHAYVQGPPHLLDRGAAVLREALAAAANTDLAETQTSVVEVADVDDVNEQVSTSTAIVAKYKDPANGRVWYYRESDQCNIGYDDADVDKYTDPTSGDVWLWFKHHNFMMWERDIAV